MNTNRIIGLVIGLLAGALACCLSTTLLLSMINGGTVAPAAPPPAPTDALIDVAVDEAYLSRTMAQNAQSYPSPYPITGGQMDILPQNQAKFSVIVQGPLGPIKVDGLVTFAVTNGQLEIHIAEVRLGAVRLTGLLSSFAPDLDAQINATANQQLKERTAAAGIKLVAITTDDQFLRLYFTSQ